MEYNVNVLKYTIKFRFTIYSQKICLQNPSFFPTMEFME